MSHHAAPADSENDSHPSSWIPRTATDKEAVREQVGRILSSTLFRNSKRFPAFLRYTVEHALTSTDSLKERTIGHEVFGRDAGYDTAQDPVVRMTAGEVRKRLAHYYQLPEHAAEPIITYQSGSYVPEFFVPLTPALTGTLSTTGGGDAGVARAEMIERTVAGRTAPRWRVAALLMAGATVVATALALTVGRAREAALPRTIDRFWAPIVSASGPALLCIGDSFSARNPPELANDAASNSEDMTIAEFLRGNSVRYTDSVTLALLAGELRSRSKPFRIRRRAATELDDLRDGPVVLIGGFNNPWTLKLGEDLRFTLAADDNGGYIRDRDRPDSREWQVGPSNRLKDITETYGLITRVQDPATGHSVVAVSGLVFGTRAAGECLLDAGCLRSAEQLKSGDWGHRNIQIVVASAVIGENSGAPKVVAAHLW
jgi:hypothetical protein